MFAGKLKQIDFYRRVPVDLTEPTAPGAVISVFCGLFMIYLFFGEVFAFVYPPIRSDMYVAQDTGTKLRINFNMTYPHLPCFALSLDVLDIMGRHEVGVASNMRRIRVDQAGAHLGEFHPDKENEAEMHKHAGEGCNIHGFIMVNKVPGNFHVSSHGLQHLVYRHLHGRCVVTHTIHSLWMGDVDMSDGHDFEGQVHPLNGLDNSKDVQNMHYEYYLDIIPTVYQRRQGVIRAYQFTSNMNKIEAPQQHMPAVFFRYSLSPVTVKFSTERVGFGHFLTYVCAIVGGVFTVAGLLSRMVHTTAIQFQRRVLGKSD